MVEWLTNAGVRLEDSEVFRREAPRLRQGVRLLADIVDPSSGELAAVKVAEVVLSVDANERAEFFQTLATSCLILTGQSDNALKCQFPVFLTQQDFSSARDLLGLKLPTPTNPMLPAIKLERVAQKISGNNVDENAARELACTYFECLFERANMRRMCEAITEIRRMESSRATPLLEVMALSAIRGSATASGGHRPEEQLRDLMMEWGLIRGVDFNSADVAAPELARLTRAELVDDIEKIAAKSRAFDFVLPYRIEGREPRLLIQGQFYAGDSGSVSHKNVDQTPTGRSAARRVVREALFAEFLDGAGYVTALSGDAGKLLSMSGTDGLIQLKTAPVRLRELLQRIAFATPLEVVHAVWQTEAGLRCDVERVMDEDYGSSETARAIEVAQKLNWIRMSNDVVQVAEARIEIGLEYATLDAIAVIAGSSGCRHDRSGVVIPGYGMHDWAVSVESVRSALATMCPGLSGSMLGQPFDEALGTLVRKGIARIVPA
jgi:hypothetical protein